MHEKAIDCGTIARGRRTGGCRIRSRASGSDDRSTKQLQPRNNAAKRSLSTLHPLFQATRQSPATMTFRRAQQVCRRYNVQVPLALRAARPRYVYRKPGTQFRILQRLLNPYKSSNLRQKTRAAYKAKRRWSMPARSILIARCEDARRCDVEVLPTFNAREVKVSPAAQGLQN